MEKQSEINKKTTFLTIEKIGAYLAIVVSSFTIWATLFQMYNRMDDLRKEVNNQEINIRERVKALEIKIEHLEKK